MTVSINRRNFSPLINKKPDYFDILDGLRDMKVVLFDTETSRGWLLDAERVVLQIILHCYQERPDRFKTGAEIAYAQPHEPDSVRMAMEENRKALIREGIDAATGEEKEIPFTKMVKEVWEKLRVLGGIARKEAKEAMHSADFGMGNKVLYGFDYRGLVESMGQHEIHPMRQRLMADCGQWPDMIDDLEATVLLGRNFPEILLPRDKAILCQRFYRLPSNMSYLAADAGIIDRLLVRWSRPENPWRLTKSGFTWLVTEDPFEYCVTQRTDQCSCDPIQELQQAERVKKILEKEALRQWKAGALIFGRKRHRLKRKARKSWSHISHDRRASIDSSINNQVQSLIATESANQPSSSCDTELPPSPVQERNEEPGQDALSPHDRTRLHWAGMENFARLDKSPEA
jgi:hypothetical protein